MSRRSNVPNVEGIEKTVKDAIHGTPGAPGKRLDCDLYGPTLTFSLGEDKQKRLLEQPNTGHFNMVRALHLADLITLLNGTFLFTQI